MPRGAKRQIDQRESKTEIRDMKLWMSGEIQADVADAYRAVRKKVEAEVNQELNVIAANWDVEKWAFIAIIRSIESSDYEEISKYHRKRKVLLRCEQNRTAVVSKPGHFVVFKTGRASKTGFLLCPIVGEIREDILGRLQRRIRLCRDAT